MIEHLGHRPPALAVLQWLAQGALRKNFLLAVRLWVWWRFLYGKEQRSPPDPFTYAQCRDLLLSATHPRTDQVPHRHDPDCLCARTARQLLFESTMDEVQWCAIAHHYLDATTLTALLDRCPFAVTRRSLAQDLKLLAQLGGVQQVGHTYRRLESLPTVDISGARSLADFTPQTTAIDQLHPDLATIMHNLSLRTDEGPRFFLDLDYVVPKAATDAVDQWHDTLRAVWQQKPIPPLALTYRSARLGRTVAGVVYPVCAHYGRRAVYLCGFNPDLPHHWYNYRLDKIQALTPLSWSNAQVSDALKTQYKTHQLPTPQYVETAMSKAWGFDFYLPFQLLLLRFEREFHDAYIAGTVRHDTFTPISYQDAIALIHRNTPVPNRTALATAIAQRSPHDAYYRAYYRSDDHSHDTNVVQRLRAWRPYVEVLLPISLRQQMAAEVAHEARFYPFP